MVWRDILKIIFPSKCIFCNAFTQDDMLVCANCWPYLEFISEPKCKLCGFPFQFDIGCSDLCAVCLQQKPCFDCADALLKYNARSKTIIHKLKYSDQLYLAGFFAELLVNRSRYKVSQCNMVICVPMHKKRLMMRRYNQAALLASNIAKLLRLPFRSNVLLKIRHDTPQTNLNRDKRLENVVGSFAVSANERRCLINKKIILVDDVYTTGATLNECSAVLKAAGCGHVHVLTLAKVVV